MEESAQIEPQKFNLNTAIWVAIKSQLIGIGIMIIPLIILMIIFKGKEEPSKMPYFNTIAFLSVALGEYLVIRKTMKLLKLESFPIKKISTLIFLLLFAFVIFGGTLIGEFSSVFNFPDIIKWHEMSKLDVVIGGIIFAPILEELLFRGLILEGLLKTYSPQKAIVFSSIIFGVIHFNPAQILSATLMGLFLGWLYVKSKSIVPSIIVHFINNFLAFAPYLFFNVNPKTWEDETLFSWVGNVWLYVLLIVSSLVISLFVIKTLDRKYGNQLIESAHI